MLYRIRVELVACEIIADAVFAKYDALGIKPTSIACSKGEHQRAIFLLGEALSNIRGSYLPNRVSGAEIAAERFRSMATGIPRQLARL